MGYFSFQINMKTRTMNRPEEVMKFKQPLQRYGL